MKSYNEEKAHSLDISLIHFLLQSNGDKDDINNSNGLAGVGGQGGAGTGSSGGFPPKSPMSNFNMPAELFQVK